MTTALHGRGDSSSSSITVIPNSIPFHHLYFAEEIRQDLADQKKEISATEQEKFELEGEDEVDTQAVKVLAKQLDQQLTGFSDTAKAAMVQSNRQRNLLRVVTAAIDTSSGEAGADERYGSKTVKEWRTDLPFAKDMLILRSSPGGSESHASGNVEDFGSGAYQASDIVGHFRSGASRESDTAQTSIVWPTTPEEKPNNVTPATVDRLWESSSLVPSRGVQAAYSLLASLWTISQTGNGPHTAVPGLVREKLTAHELWPSLPETSPEGVLDGYNETMAFLTLDTLRTLEEAYVRDTTPGTYKDLSAFDGTDVDYPVF